MTKRCALSDAAKRLLTKPICFGAARTLPEDWPAEELDRRSQEMLCRVLNIGTTVAFVGAGASACVGYPSWDGLIAEALQAAEAHKESRSYVAALASYGGFERTPEGWKPRKGTASDPTRRMFLLGQLQRLDAAKSSDELSLAKRIGARFCLLEPAKGNEARDDDGGAGNPVAALLGLPIQRFVTSNYDCEIEYCLARRTAVHFETCGPREPVLGWDAQGRLISWPLLGRGLVGDPRLDQSAVKAVDIVHRLDARRSFTQVGEFSDRLAEFVLARRQERGGDLVFHCHGRCDDPASMILTEEDYQKWYLAKGDSEKRAFQQTIELLLGSNPILFIGYGMGDQDLLRALRHLGMAEPRYKHSRPLFVVRTASDHPANAEFEARADFERFGVHVIRMPQAEPSSDGGDPRTRSLTAFLGNQATSHREWQRLWNCKPAFRKRSQSRTALPSFWHYWVEQADKPTAAGGASRTLDRESVEQDMRKMCGWILKGVRTLVLLGPGGTGKSLRAVKLMEGMAANDSPIALPRKFNSSYGYLFFWSSYYADDWLTGIDHARDFLRAKPEWKRKVKPVTREPVDRFTHLAQLLETVPAVLVFDGFERVLRTSDHPEIGRAYSTHVSRFLEVVGDRPSDTGPRPSVVILTSRLWPKEFGEFRPPSAQLPRTEDDRPLLATALRVAPLRSVRFEAQWPGAADPAAICSLLGGHAYVLNLARRYLESEASPGEGGSEQRGRDLIQALQRTSPNQRPSRMIGEAVEYYCRAVDADEWLAAVRRGFLERLALFMSPVGQRTIDVCVERAREFAIPLRGSRKTDSALDLVKALRKLGLVFEARTQSVPAAPTKEGSLWTMHPVARGYVFHRLHKTKSDELPNFTLAGFTSGTAAVDPGSKEAAEIVKDLLIALISRAAECFEKNCEDEARNLCRAAFSLFRSRMEANTAARWCPYDEYIRYGVMMLNLVRALSRRRETEGDRLWSFSDTLDVSDGCKQVVEHKNGILYPEELAWLYNDIGLALCCEGNMYDTFAVWSQGYEINKLIDRNDLAGQFTIQSKLHLSHTYMELGNIGAADQYLEETKQANAYYQNKDYDGRIQGYEALLAHLRGDTQKAGELYPKAIKTLQDGGGNPRAESKFLQHYGDMKIHLGRYSEAEELLCVSRSIAETANLPDLVAYARNSLGHLYRARRRFPEARHEYNAALVDARRMGIRRLESDALSELSRLALDQRDPEAARQHAMESMRLANELGLGLRQCHGMVILGLASVMNQQPRHGESYLRVAFGLCRERGYWLRMQEAERELRKLGIDHNE